MSSVIAIVGRPNVGKSALFNRIAGRRIAIVHDQPGVTRDRVSAEVEWRGRPFTLIDTGGIGLTRGEKALDAISQAALEQVQVAIDSAELILLVVNVQEGIQPLDSEVADRLRRAAKNVVVVVNKADNEAAEPGCADFARLGFELCLPVSAIHGRGIDALMRAAFQRLPPSGGGGVVETGAAAAQAAGLKLAIVGRPNVGKSSLVNALSKSARVIVSPIPGTTRDSVDVPVQIETAGVRQRYVLIDTAGIRKRRRVDNSIEFFSVKRAEDSIARCDIAVLVLDAESGILEQDKKIADAITLHHRACILVVNKWDLVAEDVAAARREEIARRRSGPRARGASQQMTTLAEFGQWVQRHLFFLDYAPVIFTSAKSGFQLDRLIEAIRYVQTQLEQKIPTPLLNRVLHDAVEARQPVSSHGQRLKFFYATQTGQAPPAFLLFVNRQQLFSKPYAKYLAGALRQKFGYEGCPILLHAKSRPQREPAGRKGS